MTDRCPLPSTACQAPAGRPFQEGEERCGDPLAVVEYDGDPEEVP
jgi:hypothetical protein